MRGGASLVRLKRATGHTPYEEALIELGILEQRALGRIVYGQA
jgi:hypothetical protein